MLSENKHVVQICRSSQSAALQTVQVERRTSPSIERSLSGAVVIKTKSLPVSATTFPTALSLYIAHNGRKHKPQRSPRISTSYKFAASRYRLPWPCRLFRWASNLTFQRRRTKRKRHWTIAQSCRSPTVSAGLRYHVSNSVVFVQRAGTLAKGYLLSKLFSKAEPLPFIKKVYSSTWSTACTPANTKLPLPIVIHQSLDPAARTLKRQAPCLYMYINTRQDQNVSTRWVF